MDPTSFDRISRLFAKRRLTRRVALAAGASASAALVAGGVAAEQATPGASPTPGQPAGVGAHGATLFVQSFGTGTLTPKPPAAPAAGATPAAGIAQEYVLTLAQGLGDTVFFSDRPKRIVGSVPTPAFLKALGFGPGNPPNAALVGDLPNGDQDILVVELLNPRYDPATRTATDDVRLLEDVERRDLKFVKEPHRGQTHPAATYGASHLFIDDCPDGVVQCARWAPGCESCTGQGVIVGDFGTHGFCWSWDNLGCVPCEGFDYWTRQCNATFATACAYTDPARYSCHSTSGY